MELYRVTEKLASAARVASTSSAWLLPSTLDSERGKIPQRDGP